MDAERLGVEHVGELRLVAMPPGARVEPDQRPKQTRPARFAGRSNAAHALASLRCAAFLTASMLASRARSARAPVAVNRYGLRRSSLFSGRIRPRDSSRAIAPYRVPGPNRTPLTCSMSSVMA